MLTSVSIKIYPLHSQSYAQLVRKQEHSLGVTYSTSAPAIVFENCLQSDLPRNIRRRSDQSEIGHSVVVDHLSKYHGLKDF